MTGALAVMLVLPAHSQTYTFSTLAGNAGYGSADGTGSAARFWEPAGVAVDCAGNVYVADTDNYTIRKITPTGVVTTLAGLAGVSGSADGTNSAARFGFPSGVAVDSAGNVYVADTYNSTIRKITSAGAVTTLAGLAGSGGSADGTNSAAQFDDPTGVAVDSAGNVYVADSFNHTIRKITQAGGVTTLAGLAGSAGIADGTNSAARFYSPKGVAVDSAGNVYVADSDNNTIRLGTTSSPIPPSLSITQTGGQAIVSWNSIATGWTLQTNVNLATARWSDYVGTIVNNSVTNSAASGNLFYRLKK